MESGYSDLYDIIEIESLGYTLLKLVCMAVNEFALGILPKSMFTDLCDKLA